MFVFSAEKILLYCNQRAKELFGSTGQMEVTTDSKVFSFIQGASYETQTTQISDGQLDHTFSLRDLINNKPFEKGLLLVELSAGKNSFFQLKE